MIPIANNPLFPDEIVFDPETREITRKPSNPLERVGGVVLEPIAAAFRDVAEFVVRGVKGLTQVIVDLAGNLVLALAGLALVVIGVRRILAT